MKKIIKIRKMLCMICVFLVFLISNSFLYSYLQTNADEAVEEELWEHASAQAEETFTLDDVMEYDSSGVEKAEDEEADEQTGEEIDIRSFDKNDWKIMLINKQHPIPDDYEFTLAVIKGSMKCDERIIPELQQMMQAAQNDGVSLVIRSPYRDYERQIYLFNRKIKNYMKSKMSYLESYRTTAQAVTVPGASEHQVGLALDITSDTYTTLTEGFADTEAGEWLENHSYEYGFILRYPDGKEDITGISFEPWHFRYVGKNAAKYMYDHELTLEEFVAQLNDQ
ncbi:MAG: D-alanyl-D-alanine carboxypeptidase family protein [Lachnospiraceae bacterium]|nr:D-alanyl-D-alanine carboxypeptidase family protein [Lachnospiraceae bacterium]